MTKKKNLVLIIVFSVAIILELIAGFNIRSKRLLKIKLYNEENKKNEILEHYNDYVMVDDNASIYTFDGNEYHNVGKISKDEIINLFKMNITYKDIYFKINGFDGEYYIKYDDVKKTTNDVNYSSRYKKYILYNKNIVTNEVTHFYDKSDNLIYTFNKSFDLPIIVNDTDRYGVEFNNRLLFIKSDDVREVKDNNNTSEINTSGIAVLNYHFFYDSKSFEDTQKCTQIICLSTDNLRSHLDYIRDNNYFTPTMEELEMYIDGKINLPKSVVLTIDDGWRADIGSNIIAEYKMNGTVFLITKDYDKNAYKNEYIEVHSHGDNLHNPGACPTGQGGAIQCLSKNILIADLKKSSEKLDGTTVFCYPFYEYNNYSIEVLKEAGYRMAFGGPNEGGRSKVSPNIDKYRLPRYVIYIDTNVEKLKTYLS